MPTYWIAAIVVFFVYLLPMVYLVGGAAGMDLRKRDETAWVVIMAVFMTVLAGLIWPLTLVGTVLFFVVRWLEDVREK